MPIVGGRHELDAATPGAAVDEPDSAFMQRAFNPADGAIASRHIFAASFYPVNSGGSDMGAKSKRLD
jgi:hypothetical protein